MFSKKKRMLEILKELKRNYGMLAVKAEFEAEGSRLDELIMLDELVNRADVDLFIKIGGCEAIRDLDQCKLLGATGIMAPMIETPFAMKKFKNAANKVYKDQIDQIEWIINTETITCLNNIEGILDEGKGFLNTIAIGRVDLSASMNLDRKDIDCDTMHKAVNTFAVAAKTRNLKVGIGGGVSTDSLGGILSHRKNIDKFETRKIVFSINNEEYVLSQGLVLAMEFEILYLQYKCEFYGDMANEDLSRLKMLEDRYQIAKSKEKI